MIAKTPDPLYYAVIFTSTRTDVDDGYPATANRMLELAESIPGYLGVESAREGVGITVSYWESLEAIKQWREHPEHVEAQRVGRERWYEKFTTRVCLVERENSFSR